MVKNKKQSKMKFWIALIVLLLTTAVVFYWAVSSHRSDKNTQNISTTSGKINLNPPTKEDQKRGEDNKQAIINRDAQERAQQNQSSGKKTVKPNITYADQQAGTVEVGANVSGIFEDGGVCTATFKSGSSILTKDVGAVRGASSVNCPAMELSTDDFKPKGTWLVTVSYNSPSASGTSDSSQLNVD